MTNGTRNYSLDKSKIKFLLLEGIHERARETIERHGYKQVELMRRALSRNDPRKDSPLILRLPAQFPLQSTPPHL